MDHRDRQTRGWRCWLSTAAAPLGRRTNPGLAQSKPPPGQGFRGFDRERQGVGLHRLCTAPYQEIGLTLTQCIADLIQPFRFGFRHLAPRGAHARTRLAKFVRTYHGAYLSSRQYARIVHAWVESAGLDSSAYGTHSMRRTKAAQIYRKTGNLRAVQLLLGHTKLESTVRYLGIEVDDALSISEQVEL